MLSQRLLDIIRIFNNPANSNLVQNFELILQDIEFLRDNGLRVEIIESNSMTALCRVSRNIIGEKQIETDETEDRSL